jgi:uncharacterized protein (TIGR03067 family)
MRLFNTKWCEVTFGAAVVVALVCLGCGGSGSQGSGDPAVVGTWVGTASDSTTVWTFTFASTSTNAEVMMGTVLAYKGTYAADASSSPKHVSFTITESALPTYVGKTSNGIYKIEASTLTLASNQPGDPTRPTDFTPGGNAEVFTLVKQ